MENIHYHLDSGEFVTLTGENGAAKSTLMKATLGILKPKHGKVIIAEKSIKTKDLSGFDRFFVMGILRSII